MFESIKHKSKKIITRKNNRIQRQSKITSNVMKELISKTRNLGSHLAEKPLINKHEVSGKHEIAKEFNTFLPILTPSWPKNAKCAKAILK